MTVNRSAIVVTPKQPFLDWLHTADPTSVELTLFDVAEDPTIYLLPQRDTEGGWRRDLRKLCKEIFEEQLEAWYTDESVWPQDRSFKVFRRWFHYSYHSILIDLSDEPLITE